MRAIGSLFMKHKRSVDGHLIGLIDPARPESIEPGIRPIVELLLQWGLTPERACAGHDEALLRLPYVYFHAGLDRLAMAYRVHQVTVESRFHEVPWELVAFFPPVSASVIPQRQHGELRFRLSVGQRDHIKQDSLSYRLRAVSTFHDLLTQASNPAWLPERVAELGFLNLDMQIQHSKWTLSSRNAAAPQSGHFGCS